MSPAPTAFAAKYDGEIEGVRAREFYKHVKIQDCLQPLFTDPALADTMNPLTTS
jgi:hypothetical protein